MAIFEIGGGESGIAEYLETGQKKGRDIPREQMDERVILHGDISLTDTIIKAMDRSEGVERYVHWSLSFAEDNIPDETLKAIARDCREFFGAAYGDDELNQYVEAHRPRLKEIQNLKGGMDKRFTHIHGVIPTINLKTGQRANPLELLSNKYATKVDTYEYLKAFQETINAKYGLKSPREAMALGNGKAEAIGRHKEVEADQKKSFLQQTKLLPQIILDRMLSENIRTVSAFRDMISLYGDVSTGRKLGVPYFKIQIPGETKSVRLDDKWFLPSFIEMDLHAKRELLKSNPEYQEAGAPREPEKSDEALLKGWQDLRSKEVRYIHSSNKWAKEVYFKMDKEQKIQVLNEMAAGNPKLLAQIKDAGGMLVDLPSTRLNKYKMRSLDDIEAAKEFGSQIIGNEDGAADNVIKHLTAMESVISKFKLEEYLLEHTNGLEQYDEALAAVLASPEIVALRGEDGIERYTSETVLRIEERLINAVEMSQKKPEGERIDISGLNTSTLNKDQGKALNALCSGRSIEVINGAAGTGKSFILALMRRGAEAQGLDVYGAILQGKTAKDLERDSGINSRTIASFLSRVESGKIKLNDKSLVVVDEAGMVGSQQMQELVSLTIDYNCRLRIVGDVKQVQAVSFGSPMDKVSDIVGYTALTEIMRQKETWQKNSSEAFSRHEITEGLTAYNEKGCIRFSGDQTEAIDALVKQVRIDRNSPIFAGLSTLVIAKTNADRQEINHLIRQDLIDEGRVSKDSIQITNGENTKLAIAIGDKLMFTAPDKELGIANGESGIVRDIKDGKVFMEVDGKPLTFNQNYPVKCDYLYCVTINKSQGMTVDKSYLLLSKSMSANDIYVAMTRHKELTQAFLGEDQFKDFSELCEKMSRASEKSFSGDHLEVGKANSMVDRLLDEHRSESLITRESNRISMRELKAMDPQRVIDSMAAKHGLNKELYSVNEAGRIQCGSIPRDNVSFLTKEMGLDYKTQAVPELREMHAQMLEGIYAEPHTAPNQTQIYDFTAWAKERDVEYKEKRSELNAAGREEKNAAEKSTAKVEDIKDRLVKERVALKAEYVKPLRELFQIYRKEVDEKKAIRAYVAAASVKQPESNSEVEKQQHVLAQI